MNSKILTVILIIVAIVGGVVFYQLTGPQSNTPQSQNQNDSTGTIPEGSDQDVDASDNPTSPNAESSYVVYSKEVLANTVSKRRVIYFYANWCPTCKVANEEFSETPSRIPEDIVVIRANYNDTDTDQDEQALARKYNITYQHTFVEIDQNGNEVKKWNGGGIDELLQNTN